MAQMIMSATFHSAEIDGRANRSSLRFAAHAPTGMQPLQRESDGTMDLIPDPSRY